MAKIIFALASLLGAATAQDVPGIQVPWMEGEYDEVVQQGVRNDPVICDDCEVGTDAPPVGTNNIVQHGIVRNPSFAWLTDPETILERRFYLWLRANSLKKEQEFVVNNMTWSHKKDGMQIMNPSWKVVANNNKMHVPKETGDVAAAIAITYNCTASFDSTIVLFGMTVSFVNYGSVTFKWNKNCGPTAVPFVPRPEEEGWSGAAIFFFTAFVLTSLFCFGGCGYNFVQKGKTGMEVIPGINGFRACYAKIAPPKRYTPQMDYDGTPTDNEYGATYQANL